MSKRKQKNLFQVKKNSFGCPRILSRTTLPLGKGTLHVHSNLSTIEVTLVEDGDGLWKDLKTASYASIAWSNTYGISHPQCRDGLIARTKELNESFLQGKHPFWFPLLKKNSPFLCFRV